MRTRKRFPGDGVYAVIGGLSGDYYLSDDDKKVYRYIRPAYPDIPPSSELADCWIVDSQGRKMPGDVSPIPVRRDRIGRAVLLPSYVFIQNLVRALRD